MFLVVWLDSVRNSPCLCVKVWNNVYTVSQNSQWSTIQKMVFGKNVKSQLPNVCLSVCLSLQWNMKKKVMFANKKSGKKGSHSLSVCMSVYCITFSCPFHLYLCLPLQAVGWTTTSAVPSAFLITAAGRGRGACPPPHWPARSPCAWPPASPSAPLAPAPPLRRPASYAHTHRW